MIWNSKMTHKRRENLFIVSFIRKWWLSLPLVLKLSQFLDYIVLFYRSFCVAMFFYFCSILFSFRDKDLKSLKKKLSDEDNWRIRMKDSRCLCARLVLMNLLLSYRVVSQQHILQSPTVNVIVNPKTTNVD